MLKAVAGKDDLLGEIIMNWDRFVTESFAKKTRPQRLLRRNGTNVLIVTAENTAIALEFRYQQSYISERIAMYFGYKAVDKMIIKVL